MLALTLAAWLAGCSTPPPEPQPEPAWRPSSTPEHIVPFLPGSGVPLRLQFNGLNTSYRTYVGDPAGLATLSKALDGCVDGTATVSVSYVDTTRTGRIALVVPKDALRCHATVDGAGVDVTGMLPMSRALAAFRNTLGATKDMRFYTFQAALHVEDGQGAVTLWLDGQDPIDGSAFGACAGIDGVEVCDAADAPAGRTRLAPEALRWRRRLQAVLVGDGAGSGGR